jgi:hypothetical protein
MITPPSAPPYNSLVRVNLPLLTLNLGAAAVEGLWSEEGPLTVRRWRSQQPSVADWRMAGRLRPVNWKET